MLVSGKGHGSSEDVRRYQLHRERRWRPHHQPDGLQGEYGTGEIAMVARVKKRADTATNRESDKIIVRLPEGMRDHLAMLAAANGRSMNAEVVTALARHFAEATVLPETVPSPETVLGTANKLNAQFQKLMRQLAGLLPEEMARGPQRKC
jgi:plasmid stability protein